METTVSLFILTFLLLATSCSKNDDSTPSPDNDTTLTPYSTRPIKIPFSVEVDNSAGILLPAHCNSLTLRVEGDDITATDFVLVYAGTQFAFSGYITIAENKAQDFKDGKISLTGSFSIPAANPITESTKSLSDLQQHCAHSYKASFASNATTILPVDQTVYLAFTVAAEQKKFVLNYNGEDHEFSNFSDSRALWIAVPCGADGTAIVKGAMISATGKAIDAGTVYEADRTEVVDLGAPFKVLWSVKNLGATSPKDYGRFYAWGQTTGYLPEEAHIFSPSNYSNTTDINDPAFAELGIGWHVPTYDELRELGKHKTVFDAGYTFETDYGSVFLPAAGFREDSDLYNDGDYGYTWSSTLVPDRPDIVWSMYFFDGSAYMHYDKRYYAQSVRPVWDAGCE